LKILGNDLSRTFGWGPGFKGDERLAPLLQMAIKAPIIYLGIFFFLKKAETTNMNCSTNKHKIKQT